ncbi:MAG: hypothetical protein R2838_25445 [Caldilineaceae bacterium]
MLVQDQLNAVMASTSPSRPSTSARWWRICWARPSTWSSSGGPVGTDPNDDSLASSSTPLAAAATSPAARTRASTNCWSGA